jgi:hypothetical protein
VAVVTPFAAGRRYRYRPSPAHELVVYVLVAPGAPQVEIRTSACDLDVLAVVRTTAAGKRVLRVRVTTPACGCVGEITVGAGMEEAFDPLPGAAAEVAPEPASRPASVPPPRAAGRPTLRVVRGEVER